MKLIKLKNIKNIILPTFCLLLSGCAPGKTNEVITFKEVPLGKQNVKEKLQNICHSNKKNLSISYKCAFSSKVNLIWIDYGNLVDSLALITINDSGSLEKVEIDADTASLIELANLLEEKYGAAQKSSKAVKNKIGQDFEQKKFVWTDSSGNQIELLSIFRKIDEGRVVIKSANRVAAEKEIEKFMHKTDKSRL